jgi:hypothetical protein
MKPLLLVAALTSLGSVRVLVEDAPYRYTILLAAGTIGGGAKMLVAAVTGQQRVGVLAGELTLLSFFLILGTSAPHFHDGVVSAAGVTRILCATLLGFFLWCCGGDPSRNDQQSLSPPPPAVGCRSQSRFPGGGNPHRWGDSPGACDVLIHQQAFRGAAVELDQLLRRHGARHVHCHRSQRAALEPARAYRDACWPPCDAIWQRGQPRGGSPLAAPASAAPPGGTSHDDGRQDELTSHVHADLTPFPCCWCPPRGHLNVQLSSKKLRRRTPGRQERGFEIRE